MLTKEWALKEWNPLAPMTKEEWSSRDWKMVKWWRFESARGDVGEIGLFVFDAYNIVAMGKNIDIGLSGTPNAPRYSTAEIWFPDTTLETVLHRISAPFSEYSRNWCQEQCARFWEKYAHFA